VKQFRASSHLIFPTAPFQKPKFSNGNSVFLSNKTPTPFLREQDLKSAENQSPSRRWPWRRCFSRDTAW